MFNQFQISRLLSQILKMNWIELFIHSETVKLFNLKKKKDHYPKLYLSLHINYYFNLIHMNFLISPDYSTKIKDILIFALIYVTKFKNTLKQS